MNNQGLYRSMRRRSSPNNRQQNRKWDSWNLEWDSWDVVWEMLWIHWFSIAFPLLFHWFSRPPMLINREGSTQSSIAKNFMESGCWLVQGLLIWIWHYIDVWNHQPSPIGYTPTFYSWIMWTQTVNSCTNPPLFVSSIPIRSWRQPIFLISFADSNPWFPGELLIHPWLMINTPAGEINLRSFPIHGITPNNHFHHPYH